MDRARTIGSIVALLAFAFGAVESRAAIVPAISNFVGGNEVFGAPNVTTIFAMHFTPPTDLLVTSLGVYDTGDDGLEAPMVVALHQQTSMFNGVEIARVQIPSGSGASLIDNFRYVELGSPLLLPAGQTYQIASLHLSSGSEGVRFPAGHVVHPLLGSVSRRALQGNSLTDLQWVPSIYQGVTHGPNFLFEAVVPEPGSSLLALFGALLCASCARRRCEGAGAKIASGQKSL